MNDTGRLKEPLPARLRPLVFGKPIDASRIDELRDQVTVDRATAVMLVRCGIWNADRAGRLLLAIDRLEGEGFAALQGIEPVRGLYLAYEQALAGHPGGELAADLQRARSRNDLSATVTRLQARRRVRRLQSRLLRLIARVIEKADIDAVVPLYTHGRQAQLGTVGHHMAGVGFQLLADARLLTSVWRALQECPLGAGAVGGTSLPIDAALLARLLGFDRPIANSVQAVASRNFVIETLAALSACGITLTRLMADLAWWMTDGIGFASLPDRLSGSSSHLPQKRNPFLLEVVQGRALSPLGALVASAGAMAGKPFSNSVAVGTEAVRPLWGAIDDLTDAVDIVTAVVAGMALHPDRMRAAAEGGACSAGLLVERLAAAGTSFREAHHTVGGLVSDAERSGTSFASLAAGWAARAGIATAADFEVEAVVRSRDFGGGPGTISMARQRTALRSEAQTLGAICRSIVERHRHGRRELAHDVGRMTRSVSHE